nr:DUF5680 domain-containing protein [Sporolactobacillus mangiferae]
MYLKVRGCKIVNLNEAFLDFLVEAKKKSYASQGDDASVEPKLEGSQQLEFQNGDFFYRDIYFGMSYFIGQETVYYQEKPIWSMVYSGGVNSKQDIKDARTIYSFLRKAMREVNLDTPFRGPKQFTEGNFIYSDSHEGSIELFKGIENISFRDEKVYRLSYSGGSIR